MHELAVVADIVKIALKHGESNGAKKIVRVKIRVGEFTDLYEEWMQRYFDFASKGTIAEGAVMEVAWTPAVFHCDKCKVAFAVKIREVRDVICPHCATGEVSYVSGREFFVAGIEVT